MSIIASPSDKEENTPLKEAELFPWRMQAMDGQWYTSRETSWGEISTPTIIDGSIFHLTTFPVYELLVELPARDECGGPAVFSLRTPDTTTSLFSFKRLAAKVVPDILPGALASPKLLYVAYGFIAEHGCMQVRLRQDALRIEPLLLPRPLSFPF